MSIYHFTPTHYHVTLSSHAPVLHIADGDTFFDGYRDHPWRETFREEHAADQKNQYPYSFITLERP